MYPNRKPLDGKSQAIKNMDANFIKKVISTFILHFCVDTQFLETVRSIIEKNSFAV